MPTQINKSNWDTYAITEIYWVSVEQYNNNFFQSCHYKIIIYFLFIFIVDLIILNTRYSSIASTRQHSKFLHMMTWTMHKNAYTD